MSYAKDHPRVRVVGTVLSSADAMELGFDVLILDDTSSFLTPVDRPVAAGRPGGHRGLRPGTGRPGTLPAARDGGRRCRRRFVPPEDLVEAIEEVVERRSRPAIRRGFSAPISPPRPFPIPPAPPQPWSRPGEDRPASGGNRRQWRSRGPGRAGHHLAGWRRPTLLADLDTLEPALAQRLDVELTPNVVTALEALRFRSDLTREFAYHAGGFAVLGGLPNPRSGRPWPRTRSSTCSSS